jgi:acyl-[acyl-carrier-protein]-phospholipid O-acyltransferase/long-chain-fatty-acid--[acyl-carrier-protein] ligase
MRSIITAPIKWLLKSIFRVKVIGDQNVFKNQQKLLIIANHESFIDGLLLMLYLPIKPVFIVHYCVHRRPILRFFLKFCDYLPVESTQPLAIKKVLQLIEQGRPVVIFPEGRVSTTGSMMKVYEGPAFIAAKSGATVVPIRFSGTSLSYFSRLSDEHPRSLFPHMTMTILPPTHIEMLAQGSAKVRRRHAAEQMRKLMQWMMFITSDMHGSLYHHLLKAIKVFGRSKKIVEDMNQVEYSYGYLLKITLAISRLLESHTKPGQKVGILMPNLASTAGVFFALSARGRVPAMLNFSAGVDGLQSACIAADIRLAITSRKFIEKAKLENVLAQLQNVQILYLEDLRAHFRLRDKLWVFWHLLFPEKLDAPNELAAVLFTSGSEGKPKGVALSHSAILANIAQMKAMLGFSVDDKLFNALPMFHSFGLTVGTLLPLLEGVRVFLYPSPLHYRLIPELVYDRNCTLLAGTNTFLAKYAQFAHPYDFYSLRLVVAGAEKLSDSTRQLWFDKFGLRVLEGYGATEAAPAIASNTPMAYRSNTVGHFLPGIQYQVKPVEGIHNGGLLFVSGPNVMTGYYRYENPGMLQTTESALGKGWYDTGDIVSIDEEGFIRIIGRVKRFAKIAGEMISLETVERIAYEASPEKAHAAISQEDEQRGEQLIIFTTDKSLTREQLILAARNLKLPELAVAKKLIFIKEMPLLGSGKPNYVKLKELAKQH